MNDKEKIEELFDLCLEIQSQGEGCVGYPYVSLESNNYTAGIAGFTIKIADEGFPLNGTFDGEYTFRLNAVSERTYRNCRQHLRDLIEGLN